MYIIFYLILNKYLRFTLKYEIFYSIMKNQQQIDHLICQYTFQVQK